MSSMEIWLNAGFTEPRELITLARAAEALGFDGIDLPDHLLHPASFSSPYPYSDDGSVLWPAQTPWPDPWVAIAAMAAVTDRLRFASGVQIGPLREPFALAKAVATAQAIAGDRISFGVGVGWLREEYEAVGIDYASRGRRLDELLEVLQLLWTGESVHHHGAFFSFDDVTVRPAARVPVLIGGNSGAARRRAVRHDGWIGSYRTFDATLTLVEEVRRARTASGLAGNPFRVILTGPDLVGENLEALAGSGIDGVILPIAALGRATSLEDRLSLLERTAHELGVRAA